MFSSPVRKVRKIPPGILRICRGFATGVLGGRRRGASSSRGAIDNYRNPRKRTQGDRLVWGHRREFYVAFAQGFGSGVRVSAFSVMRAMVARACGWLMAHDWRDGRQRPSEAACNSD